MRRRQQHGTQHGTDLLVGPGAEHQPQQRGAQRVNGRRPGARHGFQPPLRRVRRRVEQALLRAEVVVHERRVDVGRPRDSPDRRAGPSVLGELVARGAEDARRQHPTFI
jgi:hypothetical protein